MWLNIFLLKLWDLCSPQSRSNPSMTGFNLGCIDELDTFKLNDIPINDGQDHPLDKK